MTMHTPDFWNEVNSLWLMFCIYFVISIRRMEVKRSASAAVFSLERAGLLLGMLMVFFPRTHLSFLALRFAHGGVAQTVGLCVTIGGLAFGAWARDVLGRSWSSGAVIQRDHRLVTDGPYAYLRHPLYTGLIVALAGTTLVSGAYGAVLGWVLLTSVFRMKARREERLLGEEFGPVYSEYSLRTGRLLPRIAHV
jgi:protein-S-isoprenylcysteine O-methyltransferase Ste14